MAIGFDEATTYYTIPDAPDLTLQDGDWCVGIWTYVSDNAGENYQVLISNNDLNANDSLNIYLYEDDQGVNPGIWCVVAEDSDGTNTGYVKSAGTPGGDSIWRLIVVQRDDSENEIQIWFCEPGAAATKEASAADTNFAAVDGGDWNVGRRVDGDPDRYYGSIAAEFFKGDFALTQAQIQALAAGLPILTLAAQASLTLDVYLPMWQADATLLDYSNNGNDATRSSAPTTETHAPVCTPVKRRRM